MHTLLTILRTIILFGAIQGFIVSCLLFFSKKSRLSNRLLAWLILLFSLACFNLFGSYQNWFGSPLISFIAQFIPLVVIMPIGPLIYFYVRATMDAQFRIGRKERFQFYPIIVDVVPQLAVIIFVIGVITNQLANRPGPWGAFIDNYNVYADIPRWMSVTFYLWLSEKYLRQLKSRYNGHLNGLALNYNWVRQFVRVFLGFQALWLVYLVPYVIPKYTDYMLDTFDWYPLYIPLAVLIYWLGIKGYAIAQRDLPKRGHAGSASLSFSEIQENLSNLRAAMEIKKMYLNPDLSLPIVSQYTGIPQKTISAVLNQHLHKSFAGYVNEYRVGAFKEKIMEADMNQFTIAGIASACGFSSQATFRRTFRQIAGMSPSEYIHSNAAAE
ncbi:MAG TPA: helix-turn-helix domain-containing protein [Puia sp.]|nr:helix-turn-helix domain-containing protein [Puia sp.]